MVSASSKHSHQNTGGNIRSFPIVDTQDGAVGDDFRPATDTRHLGFSGCCNTFKSSIVGTGNMARAMALELAPQVRVNCVCPGYVDTDMVRRDWIDKDDDPQSLEKMPCDYAPMKRMATPAEIASSVMYLASVESEFITGSALQIDGGSAAGH